MSTNGNLDTKKAAKYLGIAQGTLRNWRITSKGPKYVKLGGSVRYRKSDLDEWLSEQTVDPKEAA